MPLLIVPSHHCSPKNEENLIPGYSYPLNCPSKVPFHGREGDRMLTGTLIASQKAINSILVLPEHSFRAYNYRTDSQGLNVWMGEKEDFSNYLKDKDNPERRTFGQGDSSGYSSIELVGKESDYANAMRALLETLGDLPIIPVLQWELFHPLRTDELNVFSDIEWQKPLTREELHIAYPHGILSYPKRIWPEFYHAATKESILRVSHHPDHDNDPHYHAFHTDPRLGEIQKSDTVEMIIEKFRTCLMPIIEERIKSINSRYHESKTVQA